MDIQDPEMKDVTPSRQSKPLDDAAKARLRALARRQKDANSVLMEVITFAGNQVEDVMRAAPKPVQKRLDAAAQAALTRCYTLADQSRGLPLRGTSGHKAVIAASGALGGLGGLPTALVEIPVATSLIFRSILEVAQAHGEDPTTAETRAQCLAVFGAGGPGTQDDGVDTAFIGARLSLSGAAMQKMIQTIAPKFAAVLGQKLASQAVPVLGAVAGAGTNYAFLTYYTELAQVHFGLRSEIRNHDKDAVLDFFHQEFAALRKPLFQGKV